jgi:FkbM family methyltransferase
MAQKEYVKEIYSFEPFMPTMAQARHNMKLNPKLAEKIILFDFGLSDSDKALDISYNPNLPGAMSSIAGKNSGDLTERINLRNASDVLAPIFKKRDKKKIMLKIDCEGGEREILPDLASSGLLQQADVIIMEYHDGYYLPLVKIMEDSGFSVEITEQHDNGTGMIVATK